MTILKLKTGWSQYKFILKPSDQNQKATVIAFKLYSLPESLLISQEPLMFKVNSSFGIKERNEDWGLFFTLSK